MVEPVVAGTAKPREPRWAISGGIGGGMLCVRGEMIWTTAGRKDRYVGSIAR